ncbi:MAG: signal peptidase I [Clostridia bacterium]|nr:signal peptidase I [Clostridia bacterium]
MEEKKPLQSSDASLAAQKKLLGDIYDFIELFTVAAAIILILFTFVTRLSVVEGRSMQNTLHPEDKLLVSGFLYSPKSGDIVVVQSPRVDDGRAIVKRVIATEGQTVFIKDNEVYVYNADGSGGKLEETDGSLGYSVFFDPNFPSRYSDMAPLTVPEGMIFVMGDSRNNSYDSRSFGCVEASCVVGKVCLRFLPFSSFTVFP